MMPSVAISSSRGHLSKSGFLSCAYRPFPSILPPGTAAQHMEKGIKSGIDGHVV